VTTSELVLCLSSVLCSSASQLLIKSATIRPTIIKLIFKLGFAGLAQLISALLVVLALKTMHLSQLIPFAAAAYFLVPIASRYIFNEQLLLRFWSGALLIVIGILIINSPLIIFGG
jgi:undecaprenyl phosphate-alpha-L-ara4N flippase subunit ArnE